MLHLKGVQSLVSRNFSREAGRRAWAYGIAVLILSAIVGWRFGPSFEAGAAMLLTWTLVALSILDIRTYQLPDEITLSVLWLGLLANLHGAFAPLQSAVLGAAAGYLWLWIVAHGARIVTGREMMGRGDFKMLAMIGGKFANGAATGAFTYLAAEVFEYARRRTNESSRRAYAFRGEKPVYDSRGELRTDGTRGTYNGLGQFTAAGEGSGKYPYDHGEWFDFKLVREFVVDVSKIHDGMNSWNYNSDGLYIGGRGPIFEGAFGVYNVSGMLPAAVMTMAGKVGQAPLGDQLQAFQISGWP